MLLKNKQGSSLLELMVVLGLVALLMLVSHPVLIHVIANSQSEAEANKIMQALKLARNEAINSKRIITLCPVKDNECLPQGTLALTIFHDRNHNRKIDSDEEIIRRFSSTHEGSQIKLKASFGHAYFRFKSDGSVMESGSILYCPENKEYFGKVITVSYIGRAYLLRDKEALKTALQC